MCGGDNARKQEILHLEEALNAGLRKDGSPPEAAVKPAT